MKRVRLTSRRQKKQITHQISFGDTERMGFGAEQVRESLGNAGLDSGVELAGVQGHLRALFSWAALCGPGGTVKVRQQPLYRADARVESLPALDLGNGREWNTSSGGNIPDLGQAARVEVREEGIEKGKHAAILPQTVSSIEQNLPHTVATDGYVKAMAQVDTKTVLWENLKALMLHHWQRESLSELHRRSGLGLASIDRIKKKQTSVGMDTLESLAEVFGLQAWHLLTPRLDPGNPPVIWLTETEHKLYEGIREAARKLSETQH
jgi:transcriptional regulator with XRE-family HTH domain